MVAKPPPAGNTGRGDSSDEAGGIMASKTRMQPCDAHHWVLPAPGGTTTQGTCRNCGAEKQFSNVAGSGWVLRSGQKRTA